MKLRNILRIIPGSQLITIIDGEKIVLENWEARDAYEKIEETKEEYFEYSIISLETFKNVLQIRIMKI